MATTVFMILMIAAYLFDGYPSHKLGMPRFPFMRPKAMPALHKVAFVVETVLFAAACILLLLKCIGVIPWW